MSVSDALIMLLGIKTIPITKYRQRKTYELEEQTLERKEQSRQKLKHWVADGEPRSLKSSVKEVTKIDRNITSSSMNGIKANAQIRVEQDVDFVLRNMKLKKLSQPHD